MEQLNFDVAVIGSGPGGYVAAIRAAQLGLKTVCIEKESSLGGTCLNVGCIPSKALLQSSEQYAWMVHHAKEHGINAQEIRIDFPQMMRRKATIVQGLTQGISELFKSNRVQHIVGQGCFVSSHELEIRQQQKSSSVTATYFILATGSEPVSLPFLPFDEELVLSSTGALSMSQIPKSLLVVGGGVIGVELASVYQRLGTQVTVVEMLERICVGMDEAVSKALLQILQRQGIQFLLGAKVTNATMDHANRKSGMTVQHLKEEKQLEADCILVAVGRRPYIQGLGLETIGVALDRGFVRVDLDFRTTLPHIYAIGDLIEGPMLAHRASEEGYAVAEQIAGNALHINYMAIPNVIYTHPEAAAVGLTEEDALRTKIALAVGTASFRVNPRARCYGDTDGFIKLIGGGKEKRLIGMHILGPQASELIHTGMLAIQQGLSLADLAHAPFAHPTLSEAIQEAARKA